MLAYLFKRLLLFVPTLLVASMLAFLLSRLAPGDSIVSYLKQDPLGTVSSPVELLNAEKEYLETATLLNLDKPAFYFSITSAAYPDTLNKIAIKTRRIMAERLLEQYGNWPAVEKYCWSIRETEATLLSLPDSLTLTATDFKIELRDLYIYHLDGNILSRINKMENILKQQPALFKFLSPDFFVLKNNYASLKSTATPYKLKIPSIRWHGSINQYHTWLTDFIKGDFGISIFRRRTATDIIAPALFWTVVLNFSAIFLAFAIAIPLGVWSAVKKGGRFDKTTSLALFMLYSLPIFWTGTMLLIFFTTNEYGMDFFKGAWLGNLSRDLSFFGKIKKIFPYLLLPIICLTYRSIAFIARQVRGGMTDVLNQEYIKTARAKGLPEFKVIWKHGFRNALFPIITMIANILPASIAGSITIELIYNLPGLGLTLLDSINEQDWPIVFAIMMLGAVLTIVGILLSDVLYALADPRIRFKK